MPRARIQPHLARSGAVSGPAVSVSEMLVMIVLRALWQETPDQAGAARRRPAPSRVAGRSCRSARNAFRGGDGLIYVNCSTYAQVCCDAAGYRGPALCYGQVITAC